MNYETFLWCLFHLLFQFWKRFDITIIDHRIYDSPLSEPDFYLKFFVNFILKPLLLKIMTWGTYKPAVLYLSCWRKINVRFFYNTYLGLYSFQFVITKKPYTKTAWPLRSLVLFCLKFDMFHQPNVKMSHLKLRRDVDHISFVIAFRWLYNQRKNVCKLILNRLTSIVYVISPTYQSIFFLYKKSKKLLELNVEIKGKAIYIFFKGDWKRKKSRGNWTMLVLTTLSKMYRKAMRM